MGVVLFFDPREICLLLGVLDLHLLVDFTRLHVQEFVEVHGIWRLSDY